MIKKYTFFYNFNIRKDEKLEIDNRIESKQ